MWSYNRFWQGKIIWGDRWCAFSIQLRCDNRILNCRFLLKCSQEAKTLSPLIPHWFLLRYGTKKDGGKQEGETLFYALTHCGKNSFHTHTHLLYSTTNSYRRRTRGRNKTWSKNRKENRVHYICILTSHSKLLESRPTAVSVQAACQWKKEKTGGDKEEVGWCEMDQTMDVRKALLFSTNCRQKRKGVEEEWGCVITCSFQNVRVL